MSDDSEKFASFSFNKGLNLRPWNETILPRTPGSNMRTYTPSKTPWKLAGTPLRNPVILPQQPSIKTPGWTSRRATMHGQGDSDRPDFPSNTHMGETLRSGALSALPNATQAEFWLQRAHSHRDNGNLQAAIEALKQGLTRRAQPIAELTRALADYESGFNVEEKKEGEADISKLASAQPGCPTSAPKPALSSTTSKILRKKSLSTKTTRFQPTTPLTSATPKVSFQTPQVNISPADSPDKTATNSISAGSTPYRPRLSFGSLDEHGSELESEDEGLLENEMKSLVLPILERTMDEMHDSGQTEIRPASRHAASKPRFLAGSCVTPSGAAHLPGLSHGATPGPELLQAFSSPSDGEYDDEGHSEDWDEDLSDRSCFLGHDPTHSVDQEDHLSSAVRQLAGDDGFACTPSVSPLAAITTNGAGKQNPDVSFRVNDLFGVERTPSPVSSAKNQYTPATKMTPMQDAVLTPSMSVRPRVDTTGLSSPVSMQSKLHGVVKPSADLPPTPKSLMRSRRPADQPSTSKPSRFSAMRPRVGKNEMKALLEEDVTRASGKGSISALSPVRTPARLKSSLGANEVLVTPVRRSARKSVAPRPTPASQLQSVNYAYMPNPALSERFDDSSMGPPQQFRDFAQDESELLEKMGNLSIDSEITPIASLRFGRKVMPLGAHQESPDDQSQPAALSSSPTKSTGCDLQLNGGHENQPPSNQQGKGVSTTARKGAPATTRMTRSSMKKKISMSPTEAEIRSTLRRSDRNKLCDV